MLRQYELVDRVLGYDPKADEALINRAYVYAMKQHGSQKRASGDPYFSHPIEVAGILTDLKLDTATIVTALLHDTIEDTGSTMEELTKLFGAQVAGLVDGVTKLTRLELTSERSKQAENFRKFLLAMSNDIRVLLVKLADRLHNMRTLHFISSADKRQRIALETMEIYAPLAGRMGIQEVREELEDLAFKELNPEARETLLKRLNEFREASGDTVKLIADEIKAKLNEEGLSCEVIGREKRPYSMWRKMERRAISLEQLSDIFGFRVVVDEVPDCYRAVGILHTNWPMVPGRFKDYISTPKANGYRSVHTTMIGPQKKRAEVQIRTRKMHEVAEYGIAAHWLYKEAPAGGEDDETSGDFAGTFRWLRQLIEMLEHGGTPEEFLEHTKLQMFSDQVFCFTPNGLLITLPRGATPIDFAYAVHTEVGDTCVGCKINGRHMPLRTHLENGDEVEIIRSQAQRPAPAWEAFVATGKARSAIRRSIRATKQAEFSRLGRQILKSAFEQAGKEATDTLLERAIGPLRKSDLNELLASVGDGTLSAPQVLQVVYPTEPTPKDGRKRGAKMNGKDERGGSVRVTGRAAGLVTRFAPDMFPLPGERIVGIMMPGEGITIYPIDTPALEEFDGEPLRWIDATWDIDPDHPQTFPARLRVTARNEVGSLANISTLIADYGSNIANLSLTQRDTDFYDIQIDLEVRDLKHLTRVMSALNGLSCVNSVVRPRR
ncbi:(p)ppGpp synthetase I, SpoT/RelA [Parvibaculum lavamentivorans DS-1]|uniref:GTP pyrophosphokinase rsh n=1 Tax=Parvibaculum lavamentivorans (strain DS-1 / DSM 13023 / NCIMB 13966) TaxID=402881 RepID=A7HX42_PARL1|nr:bifunctional (p)ppGpp synthetase/guanosine-3',5'-bis(diphosphate) 3'-pyrophosphohydrolase [Parvibaculum lavamentivorans]ABS64475.1 (p)ppGpp synthetase I, SpoT/RelA [Parvibaculum lavamentivorans DS-1]